MGTIKVKFISEGQDAFQHPVFEKGGKVQKIQIEYGAHKMEQIETPDDDFIIEIDVDKDYENFNWNALNYPNDIIKEQVLEVIYYSYIKNRIEERYRKIKYMNYDERREMVREAEKIIPIVENMKQSKYIKSLEYIIGSMLARDLKYTIQQKEGDDLLGSGHKLSNRAKEQLVDDFKNQLESELCLFLDALNTMEIKNPAL
jgi:hypothetical protein